MIPLGRTMVMIPRGTVVRSMMVLHVFNFTTYLFLDFWIEEKANGQEQAQDGAEAARYGSGVCWSPRLRKLCAHCCGLAEVHDGRCHPENEGQRSKATEAEYA